MNKLFTSICWFVIFIQGNLYSQTLTSITTLPVILTGHCLPLTFTVSYTTVGTANAGNTFIVQLSDKNGSFVYASGPAVSAYINSTTSGSATITMPDWETGSHYRFRVVSTNPAIIGSDNGSDLLLVDKPRTPYPTDIRSSWMLGEWDSRAKQVNYYFAPTDTCLWTVTNGVIDSGQLSGFIWVTYNPVLIPTQTIITFKATSYGCLGDTRSFPDSIFPLMTNITMDPFTSSNPCTPRDLSVTLHLNGSPEPNNKISIQLSDTNGAFINPTKINYYREDGYKLTSNFAPLYTSSHYRIRIVNTDPPMVSNDNGTDLFFYKNSPVTTKFLAACPGTAVQLVGTPPGGSFNISNPDTGMVSRSYTYTFTDSNGCTISSQSYINRSDFLNNLGQINSNTGYPKVCPYDTQSYSIESTPGTSYVWTAPPGAIIIAGQGTYQVDIKFTSGFLSNGNLSVALTNSCSAPFTYTLLIERNVPLQPSSISGIGYGVCGLSNVGYSVVKTAGFYYQWATGSPDATIFSGQNTKAIKVNYAPGFVTSVLSVSAKNTCGISVPSTKTIYAKPAAPSSLVGPTTVCANQSAVIYSLPTISNVLNYTWVGPTGSLISDGAITSTTNTLVTTSPTVSVQFANTSGVVKARVNNACASGNYKSLTVNINCRESEQDNSMESFPFIIYPNPTSNELTILFDASSKTMFKLNITDLVGKTIYSDVGESINGENKISFSIKELPNAVYFVNFEMDDQHIVRKLMVQ